MSKSRVFLAMDFLCTIPEDIAATILVVERFLVAYFDAIGELLLK